MGLREFFVNKPTDKGTRTALPVEAIKGAYKVTLTDGQTIFLSAEVRWESYLRKNENVAGFEYHPDKWLVRYHIGLPVLEDWLGLFDTERDALDYGTKVLQPNVVPLQAAIVSKLNGE